jgi:hypothetical protein
MWHHPVFNRTHCSEQNTIGLTSHKRYVHKVAEVLFNYAVCKRKLGGAERDLSLKVKIDSFKLALFEIGRE